MFIEEVIYLLAVALTMLQAELKTLLFYYPPMSEKSELNTGKEFLINSEDCNEPCISRDVFKIPLTFTSVK